jgi:CheY-like chemotaxis protein
MVTEPLHVLIIDDMPEIRRVIRLYVERALNANVREAATGLEAVERVVDQMPDLIFCDLNMPEMTGFEFLGFFRNHRGSHECTVVVLTTEDDDPTRLQAGKLEAAAFLRKPFDPAGVQVLLGRLLPQRAFRQSAA